DRVVAATPRMITVAVTVAKDAVSGPRDIEVNRAVATNALFVYDKIDYIKVLSDTAVARLGGNTHPKGYVQFEAIAYHRGLDDKDFVGTINPSTGLFTPASEGPNPKRKFSTDNFGDVWAVATVETGGGEKPLIARGFLIVTIPLYMRWDQPEIAE